MQVTTDSRTPWEKMRRKDLWDLADAWNVSYPAGAPKDDMIKILSANQVNPDDPRGAFEWDITTTQDETGNTVVIKEPRRKAHATASKNIDYEGIMTKQAQDEMESENTTLRNELDELKAMMAKMIESHDEKPVISVDLAAGEDEAVIVAYSDMKFHKLKKLAKQKGLVIPNTDKKVEVIAKLEELDGKDTTPVS